MTLGMETLKPGFCAGPAGAVAEHTRKDLLAAGIRFFDDACDSPRLTELNPEKMKPRLVNPVISIGRLAAEQCAEMVPVARRAR